MLSVRLLASLPSHSLVPQGTRSSLGSVPRVSSPHPWLICSPLDQGTVYICPRTLLGIPCHPQRRGSSARSRGRIHLGRALSNHGRSLHISSSFSLLFLPHVLQFLAFQLSLHQLQSVLRHLQHCPFHPL